jgi:hypothetical protein
MTRWPYAAALRSLLEDNGLPVIGEAADGRIAVRPDQVVVLDFET